MHLGLAVAGDRLHAQHAADVVFDEADRARPVDPVEDPDIVQLDHVALELEPVNDVATLQVDDHDAAARLGIAAGEILVERQALEALIARFGEPNDGKMANEREAAQVTRAEGQRLEATLSEIDGADMAGAALEHPQTAVVPAWRVRHGQAPNDDLPARDVDQDTAVAPPVAPPVGDVGPADRGDERGFAVAHGKSVQMATVLSGKFADERRLPKRLEAVAVGDRGQAAEHSVDEDPCPLRSMAMS